MKHVTKQRALESINISEVTFNKKKHTMETFEADNEKLTFWRQPIILLLK